MPSTAPYARVCAEAAERLPELIGTRRPNSIDVHQACVEAALSCGAATNEDAHRWADRVGELLADYLAQAELIGPVDELTPVWRPVADWIAHRGLTEVLSTMRALAIGLAVTTAAQ